MGEQDPPAYAVWVLFPCWGIFGACSGEICQCLPLKQEKRCVRGNSQERDLERESTEQGAVGGQPSEELNHAIVPREQTEGQNLQQPSHNGLMEPNAAEASPIQAANGAFSCQQPEDDHNRHLEDREMPPADVPQAVVALRYPNGLMEINVEVLSVRPMQETPLHRLQSWDTHSTQLACYPQPDNGQTSGRLWSFEETSPLASHQDRRRVLANGVSYSIQETNHSQEQGQAVEHVCTVFLREQQSLNRPSPPEAMLTAGMICDGKYRWPIKNFSWLVQDAVNGKIASVESPAIHKGLFEYKFFVRFFPKGINSRDGRHVSLFIGMMQGEHDHTLKWPFSGKISLTILDQSDAEFRNDISGTFVAKRNLRAFQKPAAAQNPTLYGYAEFAPIQLVCSPRYSRDDTVIVKIEIDIIH